MKVLEAVKRRISLLQTGGRGSARFLVLWKIGSWMLPDYRFRWLQLDWRNDSDFNRYLARFDELHGLNTGRRWMVHQLVRLVADVPGDTAECGVFYGGMSYLVCKANEIAKHPRIHFMFDSCEGLSAPVDSDGGYWQGGDLSVGEEIVSKNLSDCQNYRLLKGWIPDRFPEVADRTFAFVHVDVDLHHPTRDSLAFFYERMSEGGIIVVDDYGSSFCPGATQAVDEFLADKPEKMIPIPDGGGFIIKGRFTAPQAKLMG